MTEFLNALTQNEAQMLALTDILISLLTSLLMGFMISFTYYKANESGTVRRTFVLALLMLPIIMSAIILFVGSNIARAFSLAGTVSIIRFRSDTGSAKDIGYVFFAVAAGLTSGIGYYVYGALFVILLCAVLYIAEKSGFAKDGDRQRILKITVPEDLNYSEEFETILSEYADKYSLNGIKTADLGSVFVLTYQLKLKKNANTKELLDKLRCRNSNLNISLTTLPGEMM